VFSESTNVQLQCNDIVTDMKQHKRYSTNNKSGIYWNSGIAVLRALDVAIITIIDTIS